MNCPARVYLDDLCPPEDFPRQPSQWQAGNAILPHPPADSARFHSRSSDKDRVVRHRDGVPQSKTSAGGIWISYLVAASGNSHIPGIRDACFGLCTRKIEPSRLSSEYPIFFFFCRLCFYWLIKTPASRAQISHRTCQAEGLTRQAHCRAKFHHGLIEISGTVVA